MDDWLKALIAVVAVLVALPLLAMLLLTPLFGYGMMSYGGMGGYGMGHGGMGGYGAMGYGFLLALVVPLALLVALGYAVYRLLRSEGGRENDAIDELRAAYARGDLTTEEYEERRERLERSRES